MYKILFADDEKDIREIISDYMLAKGLDVDLAKDGEEATEKALLSDYDLIILDVMMPVMNGYEACKEIRREKKTTPILFMSALGEEQDMMQGYLSGSDDYLVKPFPLAVLHQKILSMVRMAKGASEADVITISGVSLNLSNNTVTVDGEEKNIKGKNYQILRYLMENKNATLSRDHLIVRIWGYDFDGDERVVDQQIKRLRKALGEKGELVKSVMGEGYMFKA